MYLFYKLLGYCFNKLNEFLIYSSFNILEQYEKHPLFFYSGDYLKNKGIRNEDWLVFIFGGTVALVWIVYIFFLYMIERKKDKY